MSEITVNDIAPITSSNYTSNQYWFYQWINNSAFYVLANNEYWNFYNMWVRNWLYWYDGFVPWLHNSQGGIFSTRIGTTIINRIADSVFGGGLMFENSTVAVDRDENGISKALDFISNDWSKKIGFKNVIKKALKNAFAGGSSLLKLNGSKDGLWLDSLRMDRFFADVDFRGKVKRCKCYLSTYTKTVKQDTDSKNFTQYYLVEERYFIDLPLEKQVPVVEYKVYQLNGQINNFSMTEQSVVGLEWNDINKSIRKSIREDFGAIRLNKPERLPFANNLGCVLINGTESISNLPQVQFGESLLSTIMSYLYSYDYYFSALNTDMYLGRGRVMLPKGLSSGNKNKTGYNNGLDDFVYTKVEYQSTDDKKIEAIQFDLRALDWKEIRNNLLESMATALGISVSTLASYLNDGSNRTAREVSAEESATTLFIEDKRRLVEKPINEIINLVLKYYGYVDNVEIRWSKSGMTNISLLTDTLSTAINAGLVSREKAHSMWNFDDDEEQNKADYEKVLKEEKERQASQQNSLFGNMDYSNNTEIGVDE